MNEIDLQQASIGTVKLRAGAVAIVLVDPMQRDEVLEVLSDCVVKPLKLKGTPHFDEKRSDGLTALVSVNEMSLRDLRLLPKINKMRLLPDANPERSAAIEKYAEERVRFETEWAAKHPDVYDTIVITGANELLGAKSSAAELWKALKTEFSRFNHQAVSLATLEEISSAARAAVE